MIEVKERERERQRMGQRRMRERLKGLPEPAIPEDLARAMFLAGPKPKDGGWDQRTPGRSKPNQLSKRTSRRNTRKA